MILVITNPTFWGNVFEKLKTQCEKIDIQHTDISHIYPKDYKKHNIDLKDIETYFALLKRTAKKNHVEIFRVTSGNKKQDNALSLLNKALFNIKKKRYIKNRSACAKCEFHKTKECP